MNKIDNNLIMKTAGQIIYGYFRNHELKPTEAYKFIEQVFDKVTSEAQKLDDLTDEQTKKKPELKNRKKVNFDKE